MKPHHTQTVFTSKPAYPCSTHYQVHHHQYDPIRRRFTPQRPRHISLQIPAGKHRHVTLSVESCQNIPQRATQHSDRTTYTRRAILLAPPFLATGACLLRPLVSSAEETSSLAAVTPPLPPEGEKEEAIASRIYDATAIGEPMAVGKDKRKVWEKLMNSRVVYLGEAEQVPVRDDKELELEIVRNLRKRCIESQRQIAFAMEAFPCDLQDQLNQYVEKRIDGETLKSYVSHWPPQRWQEYEPLLSYCRDNAVQIVACGTPLKQ